MGVCNCSMFCCTLLYVHSSIAIILMGKRELIALLNLSSWCLVMVEQLFLAVPRGCLQFVIAVFPDHTHLLFLTCKIICKQFTLAYFTYSKKKKKKKKKNMLGIKTLILLHLTTETLLLSQTRLSFKKREIANFYIFLISAISEGSGESVHFRKCDLSLKFEK